ncbi:hypothetical protein CISIN_1g039565mg, partial [Citrus sinensis]
AYFPNRNKLTGPLLVELIGKQKNNALELGFRGNPELVDQQGKEEVCCPGLEYLHQGLKHPIIQRDMKSTNILLNEKVQAKLADFGQSRISPVEGGTHMSTTIAGTAGFLNTELTEKSDVDSFEIVILEIITGILTVDLSFKGEFDIISVEKAVEIAMASVSSKVNRRPLMNQVVMVREQGSGSRITVK